MSLLFQALRGPRAILTWIFQPLRRRVSCLEKLGMGKFSGDLRVTSGINFKVAQACFHVSNGNSNINGRRKYKVEKKKKRQTNKKKMQGKKTQGLAIFL